VFDISYFRQHPEPFYLLAKELYPGRFAPTLAHCFVTLLERRGLLSMLFTQNIDCLERAAGVSAERIVEAHGSFASQRCIDCGVEYPDDLIREHVEAGRVPRCDQPRCGGLVKPDIVFFGESLPKRFNEQSTRAAMADLVLVIGTSLSVFPFGALPEMASPGVPRVLVNLERVGRFGTRADDVLALGPSDAGIRELADALGWLDELEAMWRALVGEEEAERQIARLRPDSDRMAREMDALGESLEAATLGEGAESESESESEDEGPEEGAAGDDMARGYGLNRFGSAFHEVVAETNARVRIDSFEHSVV
jgi:NAD-dependent histone deacetylase SIR2